MKQINFFRRIFFLLLLSSYSFAQVQIEDFETRLYRNLFEGSQEKNTQTNEDQVSASGILYNEVQDGGNAGYVEASCSPLQYEETLLKSSNTQQFARNVEQFMKRCGSSLSRGGYSGLLGLYAFTKNTYQFTASPDIRKIEIKLPGGTIVTAFLAMKPNKTPRPLVIVKCGVLCSAAATPAVRNYMMNYFDQSPFHVLFLGSTTGLDYIAKNHHFAIGGWSEGAEIMAVGKWVKQQSEIMENVSSLHASGISLGGNAAMFASYYNDREAAQGQRLFNSVTAICPVINLRDSLDYEFLFNGIIGYFFTKELKSQLLAAKEDLTDVGHLISKDQIPNRSQMTRYVAGLSSVALSKRNIKASGEDWLKWNNFFNINPNPTGPLLAIAAKDDSIVNARLNSGALKTLDRYQSVHNMGVILLAKGNHCAFHTAYGMPLISTILRDHVLRHSPEFLPTFKIKTVIPNIHLDFQRAQTHVSQKIYFGEGSTDLYVEMTYFTRRNQNCTMKKPEDGDQLCLTRETLNFPISHFAPYGARVPQSKLEAEQLSREFNARIQLVNNGQSINGTTVNDMEMRIRVGF
ncbi:MAG TPA: hypothetical protein PLU50_06475 [Pseudobdellovibrionaceae bacterium]|nr:hypothetical protein [Pseudobdellovibrionaceae bacterium]